MKTQFILILFIFSLTPAKISGQTDTVDSLEKRLVSIVDKKEKIELLIKLSNKYRDIDFERALFYAKTLLNLSEKTNNKAITIESYILLGELQQQNNFELAMEYGKKSLAICEQTN